MRVISHHLSCVLGSKLQITLILKERGLHHDYQNTGIIGKQSQLTTTSFSWQCWGEDEFLGSKWWLVHFVTFVLMKKAIVLKKQGTLDY